MDETPYEINRKYVYSSLARVLRYVYQNSKMKLSTKHTNQESAMKKSIVILVAAMMSLALVQNASAQTATQALSLSVSKVYRIAITGGTITLAISTGTAGTDLLDVATNSVSSYAITQNNSTATKITANLEAAMPKGKLQIALVAGVGATSVGTVDISDGTARNVVTAIPMGASTGNTITYTFSAKASEGLLTSTSKTVTLTVVD